MKIVLPKGTVLICRIQIKMDIVDFLEVFVKPVMLFLCEACIPKLEEYVRWTDAFGIVFVCLSSLGVVVTMFACGECSFLYIF